MFTPLVAAAFGANEKERAVDGPTWLSCVIALVEFVTTIINPAFNIYATVPKWSVSTRALVHSCTFVNFQCEYSNMRIFACMFQCTCMFQCEYSNMQIFQSIRCLYRWHLSTPYSQISWAANRSIYFLRPTLVRSVRKVQNYTAFFSVNDAH